MSWWCKNSNRADSDTVEIKIKTTFNAAESWVDSCKSRRAQNEVKRKQNQRAKLQLAEQRSKLIEEQVAAKEKLAKIHSKLNELDAQIQQVEHAEVEINMVDAQITREEEMMSERETSIREHLTSIANLTKIDHTSTGSTTSPGMDGTTPRNVSVKTPCTAPARLKDSVEGTNILDLATPVRGTTMAF